MPHLLIYYGFEKSSPSMVLRSRYKTCSSLHMLDKTKVSTRNSTLDKRKSSADPLAHLNISFRYTYILINKLITHSFIKIT